MKKPYCLTGRLVIMILCSITNLGFSDDKTLEIAHQLAQHEFSGFKYGSGGLAKHQVDCVQFLVAVIEKRLGKITTATRKEILIDHGWTSGEEQSKAEQGTDVDLAGVQKALIDAGKGVAVKISDAQPGDFIQYWMKRKDGTWFGHAAIIENVDSTSAILFGSHKSKGGIGKLRIDLAKADLVYLVRIRPSD